MLLFNVNPYHLILTPGLEESLSSLFTLLSFFGLCVEYFKIVLLFTKIKTANVGLCAIPVLKK